jgi:hypothetical protein
MFSPLPLLPEDGAAGGGHVGPVLQEVEAGQCPKWKNITGCTPCIRITELTGAPWW